MEEGFVEQGFACAGGKDILINRNVCRKQLKEARRCRAGEEACLQGVGFALTGESGVGM